MKTHGTKVPWPAAKEDKWGVVSSWSRSHSSIESLTDRQLRPVYPTSRIRCPRGIIVNNTFIYPYLTYYSFKIFLRFWLAKITRIIHHHNQLLLTTFGRILPYWTDDVRSAATLQIIEPFTKKTWWRVWLVFKVSDGEVSNGGTF